ncbi:hypothetical protein PybrP1_005005, partial [[Pythium] brassicae (nom. inval.)]
DADAGSLRCAVCAFANFSRVTSCGLCGEALDARAPTTSYFVPTRRLKDLRDVGRSGAHLTPRQARARNRREWLRKTDVGGAFFWFRERKEHRAGVPRLAGYVLLFSESAFPQVTAAVEEEEELTTETPTAQLPKVICSVFPLETGAAAETGEQHELEPPQEDNARSQAAEPRLLSKRAVEELLSLQAACADHELRGSWDADAAAFAGVEAGGGAGVFRCVDSSEQMFYLNADSAHDVGPDHLLYAGSEDSGSTALGLGLAIISLLLSTCCCIYKCHKRSRTSQQQPQRPSKHHQDPLREALVSDPHDDRLANRAHVTFRHAAEGANMCAFCGFENLRRFLFCRLCTSALAKPPPRTNASAADDEELVIRETRRPLRTLNVEQRQVRAKLRGEWQRRIDVAGDLFWFRDDAGGFNTSATRFPGFALRFEVDKHAIGGDGRGGAPGSSSKVVVETTRSKQEVVDALYLEVALAETTLVESSRANPAQIPVEDGHLGSLHWRQVLDLAATGFLTKYACFAAAAAAFIVPAQEQLLRLSVSRATLLDDSLEALAVVARGSIRASIHVSFVGDQHHQNHHQRYDEWFLFINHQLAEPAFGVFRGVSNAEQTFYLNANSLHDIGAHHLLHYFAAGRWEHDGVGIDIGAEVVEGAGLLLDLFDL